MWKARTSQYLLVYKKPMSGRRFSKQWEKWNFLHFLWPLFSYHLLPPFLPFTLHCEVSYYYDRGPICLKSPPSKAETPHEVSPYTSLFHRWEKASAVWFSVSQRGYFSPLVHNTHWFVSWCCAVPQAVWGISPCLVTPQPGRSHPRTTTAREDGNTSLVGAVLVCFIKHDPTALWKRMFYTDSMYIYFARAGGKETQTNWFWKKLEQLCI